MKDIEKFYDDNHKLYEAYASKVSELLETIIKHKNVPYHSVTNRPKARDSFIKKCKDKGYSDPENNLMDFAGIRVIAYTTNDVAQICKLIEDEFSIIKEHSEDKAAILESDKVGYLSVHYVATLSKGRGKLTEYSRFSGLKCEIQVRTLLQHAWAEIEHDRSYKFGGVLPKNIDRRFHLVAGTLELMDREFQRLSDEIDAYKQDVKEKTSSGDYDIAIDSTSLNQYMEEKFGLDNINTKIVIDKTIVEELYDMGANKLSDIDSWISDSLYEALKERISNLKGARTYLGILRDIMVIHDSEKYFSTAWKRHWTELKEDSYYFWKEYGVNIDFDRHKIRVRPREE